jgi:amidase
MAKDLAKSRLRYAGAVMELYFLTATELGRRYRTGELAPVEVTDTILKRIETLDALLHSFVTVLPASALAQAAQAEAELRRGTDRGPLHGVPVAVKDLCSTKGMRTTCGTKVLADWVPDEDAAVVERLRDAGAVLLGKLGMTEGAAGGAYHPTVTPPVNPWNAGRWPGASSSGSGVATAAGLCYGSLGSDTGGSIRFPSACCGLVGIKPTYGRVPRHGIFPLSDSLDHVGPMTRSVADAAAMLGAIAGFDERDPTSSRAPVPDYLEPLGAGVRGVRIGVDESYCVEGVAPDLSRAVLAAGDVLRELGAEIRETRVPPVRDVAAAWFPIVNVEASIAHEETFPARAEDYGPALRELLEAGHRTAAIEYARAHLTRLEFAGELQGVFEEVDLILCPATIVPPPPVEVVSTATRDPEVMAPFFKFTAPYDASGSPTITVPCGFTDDGLPLALQLVGRHLDEELLCRAAHAYERVTDWHTRHPPL